MLNLGLRSRNRRARDDQYSWQQWPGVIVSGARGCNDGETGICGVITLTSGEFLVENSDNQNQVTGGCRKI